MRWRDHIASGKRLQPTWWALVCLLAAFILVGCAPAPQIARAQSVSALQAVPIETSPAEDGRWLPPAAWPSTTPYPLAVMRQYWPGAEVSVFAGTGARGGVDGPREEAQFDGPFSLALDSKGTLYVAEYGSGRIRIIDAQGYVYTWIGRPTEEEQWRSDPNSPFIRPTGITIGPDDWLYVVDGHHQVTAIHADGRYRRLAGGKLGAQDGDADQASFNIPWDVAVRTDGALYLSDALNHKVRLLSTDGQVSAIAGVGAPGWSDGAAQNAQFNHPNGLTLDDQQRLYIADGGSLDQRTEEGNACLRTLSPDGQVATLAGSSAPGYVDGEAALARFQRPLLGLDLDAQGNLYVADMNNHTVRLVTPSGQVYTLAGTGEFGRQGGAGNAAMLGLPADVLYDGQGHLYVADYGQNTIWRITLPKTS